MNTEWLLNGRKMDEFNRRCDDAIKRLSEIALKYLHDKNVVEYSRLMGKIDGIEMARSYFEGINSSQKFENFDSEPE